MTASGATGYHAKVAETTHHSCCQTNGEIQAVLITFKTESYADITMFGDAATELLTMMGMSGNVPGALMAEDIPAALDSLRAALADRKIVDDIEDAGDGIDEEDEELPVSLNRRAVPLIALLEAAEASGDSVIWEEGD